MSNPSDQSSRVMGTPVSSLKSPAFLLASALLMSLCPLAASEPVTPTQYRNALRETLRVTEQNAATVIVGHRFAKADPQWLFFTAELKSVLSEPFWGEKAAAVSRASNPKYADPLPAILDFQQQLKAAGIDLWVVPVPAKLAVHPEHCAWQPLLRVTWRVDQSHVQFYELLRQEGVTVVDLTDEFRGLKKEEKESKSFCRTDSHWSGSGVRLAAKSLGQKVKETDWYQPWPKSQFQTESVTVEITGDLATLLDEKNPVKEKLALTRVFRMADGKSQSVRDDPASPVLLLGDSHTLVFHDPSLHAEGCGLADHLAEQLGIRLDVIGVRGSGANAARLNWRRRADPLTGKKLVIWCFSMREFTENTDGWRKIPITKQP